MKKKYNFKTLGGQAANLVTTLYEEGHSAFNLKDVRRITGLSDVSARGFARRLVERGVSTRLKPGVFLLVPFELGKEREFSGDPLLMAREILRGEQKYYFSHGTAMEIHGMVTQPQMKITITMVRAHRPMNVKGVSLRFARGKSTQFFGLTDHWVTKQEKVPVSDLERTIVDGLKQPEYCGGVSEVAKGLWMRREDMNVAQLVRYAKRLGVGAVIRRLGFLLELYDIGTPKERESLGRMLSATYDRLDPVLPPEGKRLSRWRLQLNVSPEELKAVVRI